jgi:hypothetical protein
MEKSYFYAAGRRKTAVARVQLHPGGTEIIVNGKALEVVFPRLALQSAVLEPLRVTSTHSGSLWRDGEGSRRGRRRPGRRGDPRAGAGSGSGQRGVPSASP